MAIGLKTTLRNARLNLIRDAIDADIDSGYIELLSGIRVATGSEFVGNAVLAVGTFSKPCAPDAINGVLTFDSITGDNALDDGQVVWARVYDGSGQFVMDMSVGQTGSGADIEMNVVDVVQGGPVVFNIASISSGNA